MDQEKPTTMSYTHFASQITASGFLKTMHGQEETPKLQTFTVLRKRKILQWTYPKKLA